MNCNVIGHLQNQDTFMLDFQGVGRRLEDGFCRARGSAPAICNLNTTHPANHGAACAT